MNTQQLVVLAIVGVAAVGAQKLCKCTRDFTPICGTDGRTYNNECMLQCAQAQSVNGVGLRLAYRGTCCPRPFCPRHGPAVCDNRGNRHDNECMFRYQYCVMRKSSSLYADLEMAPCASLEATDTECATCVESSGSSSEPVCDTLGNSHASMCAFHAADCRLRQTGSQPRLVLAYMGKCMSDEAEVVTAASIVESDPIVVTAAPELPEVIVEVPEEVRNIEIEPLPSTTLAPTTAAPASTTSPCAALANCDAVYSPVCDNTGRTHANLCLFEFNACLVREQSGAELQIVGNGACDASVLPDEVRPTEVEPLAATTLAPTTAAPASTTSPCAALAFCNKVYAPVCDNTGRTHANLCLFEFNACLVREESGAELQIVRDGACDAPALLEEGSGEEEIISLPLAAIDERPLQCAIDCPCKCSCDKPNDGVTPPTLSTNFLPPKPSPVQAPPLAAIESSFFRLDRNYPKK